MMSNSPNTPNDVPNRNVGNGSSAMLRLDSPDITAKIASADVIRAVDPELRGGIVFYGREMMEDVIRSGIPRPASVLKVALDFVSEEPERLDTLICKLKGNSSFRPAEIFPEVEIDTESFADAAELLDPVRAALNDIRTQHRKLLPQLARRFFYYVRAAGFATAYETLRDGAKLAKTPTAILYPFLTLGELLYRCLPPTLIQPSRCLDLMPPRGADDRKVAVRCRSLCVTQTHSGPAYFSRRIPRLRFGADRQEKLVAFSQHALEQICNRTVYDWRTYGGHGDAFGTVENCIYFEDCTAARGEPSFAVYDLCVPNFPSWNYVDQLLHLPNPLLDKHQQLDLTDYVLQIHSKTERRPAYYYRVGYCPVEFYGEIAKAITLLVPGMKRQKGTPEAKLIENSGLPSTDIDRLNAQVERQLSMKALVDGGDYSLVKWFHENGVPQVVQIERDVFKYD